MPVAGPNAGEGEDAEVLRAAVVGVGVGARYVESFRRVSGVDVAALCASSVRSVAAAGETLGVGRTYADLDLMLREVRPDIVAIATPNDLHRDMTLAAIDAGAHVLCDKPLALDARQAREMYDAVERSGLRHVMPFWLRLLPVMPAARRLLASADFGDLYFAQARYLNCGWGDPNGPMRWQFDSARAGSGALANIGSHMIDAVQWLLGPITKVFACTTVNVTQRRWPHGSMAYPDAEDTAAILGRFGNGAPLSMFASSVAHDVRSKLEVGVYLSRGSVSITVEVSGPTALRSQLMVMRSGQERPRSVAVGCHSEIGGVGIAPHDAAYTAIAAELVKAIRERRPATPGFGAGLAVQRVIDAALLSAGAGGWVDVG